MLLTVTGGMLDAISFLGLGQVFVGMMTGNVVTFGFALGGAPLVTEPAPLLALTGFAAGVATTARVARRQQVAGCGRWFAAVLSLEFMLLLTAALLSAAPRAATGRHAVITVLAVTMGMRCAALRSLAVPELQATFALTGALIALLHDLCTGSAQPLRTVRRLGIIGATGTGAAAGAVALTHLGLGGALVTVALAVAALAVALQWRSAPAPAGAPSPVRGGCGG
ncbi:YoaK family protein [Streptomyces luteireticuli]|uniref:YoaK family protein n=1 Tax=Streptomyces luteireticuli TaxID=173858 RepID=UPI0031D0B8C0